MMEENSKYDDEFNKLFKIKNLEKFKVYLKDKVWENFNEKFEDKFTLEDDEEIPTYLKKESLTSEDLPDIIFEYEISKFVIYDDYDISQGYIIKRDIFKLITSLTNEIIGRHLNHLVEKGILEMCWDDVYDEFIWRPKQKE